MKEDTDWAIQAMHIKTPSQSTQIRSLSGGNQQKVIIGRWLLTKPEVLLLDEPTRGIDVGAKYEIYQLIIDLAKEGKGVIMVSSEMPELLGVCDRILVMSGGSSGRRGGCPEHQPGGDPDAGSQICVRRSDTVNQETNVPERSPVVRQPWTAQRVGDILLNNALIIIMAIAVVYIAIKNPNFIKPASLINILSQTAAYLPAALGIGGCIVLTGTDLSAGRAVGITACISASLLQNAANMANKMWPQIGTLPIPVVIVLAMLIGAAIGCFNGFFVAKFKLHPFIVTLAHPADPLHRTAFVCPDRATTTAWPSPAWTRPTRSFVKGIACSSIGGSIPIPNYVLYRHCADGGHVVHLEQDHLRQEHVRSGRQRGGRQRFRRQRVRHHHDGLSPWPAPCMALPASSRAHVSAPTRPTPA